MTTNQDFECGHDNPASSRFCAVCGVARLRSCRACEAPVQWDAKYCGACGARLYERDAVSEQEVVEWARARRGRDEAARHAVMDDAIDDDADDGSRRRPAGVVATIAVILAAIVGLGYFALARHTVFFERMPDMRDVRSSTPITQPVPSPDAGQAALSSTSPPPASTTPPSTKEDLAASTSPDKAASPSEEQVATPSEEKVASPREPPARSAGVREARSQDEVTLPARTPARENAAAQSEDNREAPRVAASGARTSEERMARFLVDELGRERAAEKALSNADWYDEGRSERAYWQRVADAVNRHGER
jgi:hypothetical protein